MKKLLHVFAMLAITLILLAVIEGFSSFVLSAKNISDTPKIDISVYDQLLGWTGNPGIHVPDEYGEGKYVRINENGFRHSGKIDSEVQDNRIRILCSGDSFTFGQGVSNDSTWCHLLSKSNNKLETVNLAHIGYGVDQMYLRYLQEELSMEHMIHIFAFISGDLDRMLFDAKFGYGKPTLALDKETGELTTENVPVPRFRWNLHRLIQRADLRVVNLFQRVIGRLGSKNLDNSKKIEEVKEIASAVMLDVHQNAIERNVIPIFIYLPVEGDLVKDLPWRLWVIQSMKENSLNFLDLTPSLRELSAGQVSSFFIPDNSIAKDHYTEAGNMWVADTVYKNIRELNDVSALLGIVDKNIKK